MKKWLVALLGIFMLFGSCIFSACNQESASLTLSQESVSIQIRSDALGSGEAIISADVSGAQKYSITASANGYDEFITVSTSQVSKTRTNITIKGVSENDTPSIVTVRVAPGNIEKYIYVDVYSEIQSISQNTNANDVKDNYLVKGETTILNTDKILTIEPAKARKNITWSLDGSQAGVTLNGNSITISETFSGENVKLKATASNGVTTSDSIVLPVLDKIEEDISLKWSYNQNSSFTTIEKGNDEFVIVPNLASDEKYNGFVVVDYLGDLDITGYAVDKNGNPTDDVVVNRYGEYNGLPLFRVSTMQGKTNFNGEYQVGFKIGYKEYNYAFDTMASSPIKISAREKVNDITVSNSLSPDIEGSVQTLYSNYADTASATSYGQEFNVSITPTTVIDASNKYSISVSRTQAGPAIANGCPVEIWYRDKLNGNRWTQVVMTPSGGDFVIFGENYIDATTIYIKASENLTVQSAEGVRLTFRSVDNSVISTYFDVKLVKSVSVENFTFENGDFLIDSSANDGNITLKKQFTLEGQTSIEGLYIINNSSAVTFSDIQHVSNDDSSVTFEIAVTLNKSSYGVTTVDTYQIAHRNGLTSEKMNIDIFLPLKDVGINHDSGENLSNSVTDVEYSTKTYTIGYVGMDLVASESTSTQVGISRLMLKNDTTTPIFYTYNSVNGNYADATAIVGFLDFAQLEAEGMTLEEFKALSTTQSGISKILSLAIFNQNKSNVAYFTNDLSSIITKSVGYTYAVVYFYGKGVEGDCVLARSILIESYISPNSMNIVPDSDKNITLYSLDSLATIDEQLTRKTINIRFANPNVTYSTIDNLEFVSSNSLMGSRNTLGNTVTWAEGRYSLSNVVVTGDGISFNIEVVGTFGELAFYDTLNVHYVLRNDADEKVYDIYLPISLTIKNAQRVESLTWKNADDEGLYFEIGDISTQYLMMETLPTNAKNSDIHYVRTNSTGGFIDRNTKFVSVNDEIATNVLALNLSTEITSGMTGYIYLLPADAVYNNQIKYYYVEDGEEKQGVINDSILGNLKDSANGITYYDFLVSSAYFKSNASDSDEVKNISFAEIIVKIKIEVADGSSFEHAYRIYDNEGFVTMKDNLYYTVMNSLDLTGETYNSIASFKGGLQGGNEDVTIKLAGNGFANELAQTAEVRNIIFTGSVDGNAFVASVNNGKITNVTIDVDGTNPSSLNVPTSSVYAGGLVGTNNGTISSSSVLGLNITSTSASVGGFAGINYGTIENSRVEFYNLAVAGETEQYSVNRFKGTNVGGFVGIIGANSTIYKSFAYNYSSDENVLVASSNNRGAFAGSALTNSPSTTKIDYSFAFVGLSNALNNANYVTMTNYYLAYIDGGGNYKVDYVEHYNTNSNFVSLGKEGFESYVNNGGAHLKGLMQDEKVESVDYNVSTSKDSNGYYKSVAVADRQGIMFAYALKSGANDLTSSEQNDLNDLNSISLSELVGEEANKNVIITSSNPNVVKVVGSTLKVLKTGNVKLTLSSKQDVEINKPIDVTVIYSLSNMQISWTNAYGNVNYVKDNSTLTLQKTRSRDFMVGYEKTTVYLGATANSYDLVENETTLGLTKTPTNLTAIGHDITSATSFKLTANEDSEKTSFVVSPVIFENATLQSAIDEVFQRKFAVQAIDGVISFGVSGEELSITPSTNTTVKVEIKTTDPDDSVIPVISYDKEKLTIVANGANKFEYVFAKDVVSPLEKRKSVLTASVEKIGASSKDGIYTYVYNVTFSVSEDYQAVISGDMDFEVYFESESGNDSKEWDGTFTLALTRQNFTNIDVQTRKIAYSQYMNDSERGLIEVHTADELTAVLAPGNSAIMQININPAFAYFDHVDFSYSFGEEIVMDAVSVQVVEPYGNKFTSRKIDGAIEQFSSVLRYTPTVEEKARGVIYYKIWINTTVTKDSRITFTATFHEANGDKEISHVNSYLTISYLTQPTITVDGLDTAYLAKGSTAEVKIDVLPDQEVDTVTIDGLDVKGINISALSEPELDEVKGVKTYTATLSASVLAKAGEEGKDGEDIFSIQAQVSRELNGSKEYKSSVATVILVDFKVSPDDVTITGTYEDNLTVWQGVPKALNVEYTLLPEKYNSASDKDSQEAIQKLESAREDFLKDEYYPAISEAEDARYLINYLYDENGNVVTDEDGNPKPENLEDRLFYVIGNSRVSIKDTSVDSPVKFSYDKETNKMSVTGIKLSGTVELVLLTYVSAGGYTATYEKYFTLTVTTWSSKDLPTTISDASEFEALNPEGQTNITPNDYILTNDIVLENYTPFDTRAIKSLDGNGYTIYIKSFNTEPENTSTLNLALFKTVVSHNIQGETVPTTLQNVRVNLYNGGQITVNVDKYKTINIAGLAIQNEGIITNCEVVSFYTEAGAMGQVLKQQQACTLHNNPTGINVTYIKGTNTTEKQYHDGNVDWSSEIAGFVLTNSGSITNSRVGGDTIIVMGEQQLIDGEPSEYTYASYQQLDTFNIVGQGNIAGFVLTNAGGYIASSFVKNIDMENQSNSTSFYVAGFVGVNSSSIITSYVEGVESDIEKMGKSEYSQYSREGSSIRSQMGYIAGFIYNNSGSIKDSYSNILIANSVEANKVYLASGFVYMNDGTLENCYSASQIQNSVFTQMNFSGVSADGELLATGTYTNCYFFNKAYEHLEEVNDTTTESRYSTGALLIPKPTEISYFYGFAIAGGESDGIWRISEEDGITLIEPNNISISHRYICYTEDGYQGITAENEQGKYILPYSTLTFLNSSLEIDTSLGGNSNPILIVDANDWLDVTGLSSSSYISEYFNDSSIWGTYRLVNNIDLGSIASSDSSVKLPSSEKAFAGSLYGNGFEISGISITSDVPDDIAFGLFASIEKRNSSPIITNVSLRVDQVIAGDTAMVGALAGYIKEANIINVNLTLGNSSLVTGKNFAGTLAGLAFGNNVIKNVIVENPSVTADRYSSETTEDYFTSADLKAFRVNVKNNLNLIASSNTKFLDSIKNYSYAGGVIGFVDNFIVDSPEFDYVQHENFSINNIRIKGTVRIQGQVVGGGFGLLGYQTNIRDVGLLVEGNSANNSSYILSTKYFAGGIAGQSFGSISRTFASHEKEVQDLIEDNMANFYAGNTGVERGILNLFYMKGLNYTQKYIGGLVGYAGSGNIEISYSKLNVTSPSAQYAGGIIGGMELANASSYLVGEKTLAYNEKTFTKYFLNEVYATGDVRANVAISDSYAGGIIGVIQGDASRVGFLAVNAFNYFTTYDYVAGEYLALNEGQTNVSNNFKVNSLVGRFKDSDGIAVNVENIETDYVSYLSLMTAYESQNSEGGTSEKSQIPSVAVYENYCFDKMAVGMSLFETVVSTGSSNPTLDTLVGNGLVYKITGPSDYTSSTTGHTYTQVGFLNSGAWNASNWGHPMDELFPEIKYKRSSDVLYLDCYNVRDVFSKMSQSNYRVIVRGLVSEGAEQYADINLDDVVEDDGGQYPSIEEFSGKLEGGLYKTTQGKEDVKIIASQNFIKSTGPGFYASGLTVEYKPEHEEDSVIDLENGLFVNSEVNESTISDLTVIINGQVKKENISSTESTNIGLIAPTIKSTSINNIKIIANRITAGTSLLTVEKSTATFAESTDQKKVVNNVGLIAGSIVQGSSISVMQINEIAVETTGGFIAISDTADGKQYNVGGYFGQTAIDNVNGVQELRLNISQHKISATDGSDLPARFNIKASATTSVNLGGYVGYASGISYVATQDSETINSSFEYSIQSSLASLSVGGLFGQNSSASSLTINGQGSNIDTKIIVEVSDAVLENLSAGGFAGKISTGKVTLSNFSNFNTTIFKQKDNQTEPTTSTGNVKFKENLDSCDYMNGEDVQVGNANVGVVLGEASSQFKFVGNTLNPTGLNLDGQAIKLSGTNINYGSVIGYTNSMRSGGIDQNNSNPTLEITGKVYSNAQVFVNSKSVDNNITLGGMVGKIEVGSSTETVASEVIIGNNASLLRFDGAFYLNSKKTTVGGILGSFTNTTKSTSSLSISKTSFGGAVKLYGGNSDKGSLTVGGTLGFANISDTVKDDESPSVSVTYSYNYGDVFVEYGNEGLTTFNDTTDTTNGYVFGGVIGGITQGSYAISNNYSLTTSHNSKHSTVSNTSVKAIVGSGSYKTQDINKNFYNHAVTLTTDNYAVDCGYKNAYTDIIQAYNGIEASTSYNIVGEINRALFNPSWEAGHKLNPASHGTDGVLAKEVSTFNGMTYYTLGSEVSNASLTKDGNATLKNVALIGSGTTVNYTIEGGDYNGFVDELSGHSYISGFIFNADIKVESTKTTSEKYGALVGVMKDNSIVYAVNVQGTMEVGGTVAHTVSGLVGQMNSGKIYDCSSDLDLVYRAGNSGNVSGLTSSAGGLIERSYVGGSIKTMITANVYAFANGDSTTQIKHSYTFAKLDRHDYTNETENLGNVNVFGTANLAHAYYDKDGFNINITDTNITKNSMAYSEFNNLTVGFDSANWVVNYAFNYGYPTLKYGYLKRSSYAIRTETAEGTSGYDSYVLNGTFTRLANGTASLPEDAPEGSELFYMIPNGAVFNNIANIAGTTTTEGITVANGNFALLYDIDTSVTSLSTNSITFSGYLDGRDKTISNLNNIRLFNLIGNATVRNLRLTDVSFENVSGVLADAIADSTISNMTLSGFMKIEETDGGKDSPSPVVGGLANTANSSEINTVTNLIDIKVTKAGTSAEPVKVGGLIGEQTGGAILYSSNYGPMTVTGGGDTYVGGLVGETMGSVTDGIVEKASISYSYNATSVLNNYATSTALATTQGKFYTGGLVGYGFQTDIKYSYNSGMIKSGNKFNNSGSYAGGILGYGVHTIEIDNCYNEGTVEALGVNPTFTWSYENNAETNNKLALTLRTSSGQNVWAYGIGYVVSGTVTNSSVKMATGTGVSDETIYNNGAYLDSNTLIRSWSWGDIQKQLTQKIDQGDAEFAMSWYYTYLPWFSGYRYRFIKIEYDVELEEPALGSLGNTDVIVTSVNELEMPTSFILKTALGVKFIYNYGESFNGGFIPTVGALKFEWMMNLGKTEENVDVDVYENFTCNYNDSSDGTSGPKKDYYSKFDTNQNGSVRISNITNDSNSIGTGTAIDDAGDRIKENTRSKQNSNNTDEVSIGGQGYYLVDKNNQDNIFNAGIYTASGVFTSDILPYLVNSKYYSMTVYEGDILAENIFATIDSVLSVEVDGKKQTQIGYTLKSSAPITTTYKLQVDVAYEEEIIFNTSSMDYVYIDDYSVGIEIDSCTYTPLPTGYSLTTAENKEYTSIIKVYVGESMPEQKNQPTDENVDLIYLALDNDSGSFVYIPNATLKSSDGDNGITVNKQSGVEFGATGTTFTDNVSSIISYFEDLTKSGKKLYSRSESSTEYVAVNYTAGGSFTTEKINPGQSDTQTVTLQYGETVELTPEIEYIEVKSTEEITDETTGETTTVEVVTDRYYQVTLPNYTEDIIGLDADKNVLFGFDYSETTWAKSDSLTSITIDGISMELKQDGNVFTLKNDSIIEDSYTDSIKSYFESITFIKNKDVSHTFENKFDVTSGTIDKTVEFENGNRFAYKITISKTWEVEGTEGFTTDSEDNLTVSITNRDSYSLGNITVYYGSEKITATQLYTTTISGMGITPKVDTKKEDTDNSYYQVSLVNAEDSGENKGKVIKEWGNFAYGLASFGNYTATVDTDMVITGKVYNTYKLTVDDKDEFSIVANDSNNEPVYIEGNIVETTTNGVTTKSVSVNSVGQLITATDNNDTSSTSSILVSQSVEAGKLTKEDGTVWWETITTYSTEFGILLTKKVLVKDDGSESTTEYWTYCDESGNSLTTTENEQTIPGVKSENLPDNVYFKVGTKTYSISSTALVGMTVFEQYKDSVQYKAEKNDDGEILAEYLIVDPILAENVISEAPDGTEQHSIIYYNIGGTYYSCRTQIERATYDWNEFSLPDYSNLSKETTVVDTDKIEIKATEARELPNYVQISGNTITMILKPANSNSYSVKVVIKEGNQREAKSDQAVSGGEDPLEAQSIILLDDVSFNSRSFNKSEKVNIYGNGYYISYYGGAFYSNLSSLKEQTYNSYVKDVIFLGEAYSSPLLVSNSIAKTNLTNIDLYGSVVNIANNDMSDSLEVALIKNIGENAGAIKNFRTFASINSCDKNGVALISSTITTDSTTATNYGVITVVRGANGAMGNNGTSTFRDGKAGETGYKADDSGNIIEINENMKGADIYATDNKAQTDIFANSGILRVGDAGNGGAGGSSHRGADRLKNEHANDTAGSAGNAGNHGKNGTVYGFTNNGGVAKDENDAFNGINGAKSRDGFGYIEIDAVFTGWDYGDFEACAWVVNSGGKTSISEPPSEGDSHYKKIFERNVQNLPTHDVWGNAKT